MKKVYRLAAFACLGLLVSTQTVKAQVADFENLTLPAESYWDGSDFSGTHNNGVFTSEFQSGDFIFQNEYDTTWGAPGYWLGGFAYSNMTDTVTSGAGNKYSAKAGVGANNSSNYVVCNSNSSIRINNIDGNNALFLSITNSTYAYNSMRDGDMFAKKFGGASGDDPDWFKITIKAYSNNIYQDSIDFFLADYRFSDNSQDYIIKNWTSIGLPPTSNPIDSVYFELSSSDVGTWGMNTPDFFCLDDLQLSIFDNITELHQNNFSFFPNPASSVVNIKNETVINTVTVLDLNGRIILNNSTINNSITSIDVSELNAGIYFIQLTDENGVVSTQKFLKQ
jgi:hypothetical protein